MFDRVLAVRRDAGGVCRNGDHVRTTGIKKHVIHLAATTVPTRTKSVISCEAHFEPNHLAFFASVVRHRSFTEAAKESGVSKSTLSRIVSRLEDYSGAMLLERTTRHVVPTNEGLLLYQRCVCLYRAWIAANEAIAVLRAQSTGR